MSDRRPSLTIRSFRLAFELERRIHRIDRFRLPLPYGLPLRGAAYAVAAFVAVVMVGRLPVVGAVLGLLPWPIRYGVLPAVLAQLLTQIQLDGRPAHEVVGAWLRLRLGPRRTVAFAPAARGKLDYLADVTMVPDERGPTYRAGFIDGPGTVLLRQSAALTERGARLVVVPTDDRPLYRGKRIALKRGQRVVLR